MMTIFGGFCILLAIIGIGSVFSNTLGFAHQRKRELASYLELSVFLAEAPFVPIVVFIIAILGAVSLAYYLGWRKVCKINLADVLRDDTMI